MRKTLLCSMGATALGLLFCSTAFAQSRTCSFALRLDDAVELGSLQLSVDYTNASGSFAFDDEQNKVDCNTTVLNAAGLFDDDTDARSLGVAFISVNGFSGPTTIAQCNFTNDSDSLETTDFEVHVTDAAGPGGGHLDTLPSVSVHLPDCSTVDTSTTTTVTVTTTEPPQTFCDVTLRVTSVATITSLDWQLGYQNAPGEFSGSAGQVACTNLRPNSLASFNDKEVDHNILGGLIHLSGFAAPADIARCQFVPFGIDLPTASDFTVLVKQATDQDTNVIVPAPKMKVSTVTCSTDTSVCGNGVKENPPEACDDGNTVSRDGCSSTCTVDTICGDANLSGSLSATDALQILKFAVGNPVSCPGYVCDTNGSSTITAGDALSALKRAVGQLVTLACPPQP